MTTNENEKTGKDSLNEAIEKAMAAGMPKNVLDGTGKPHTAAVLDAIEEVNFRMGAFSRAYFGNSTDMASTIARARILADHLEDLSTLLKVLCAHHETFGKSLNKDQHE